MAEDDRWWLLSEDARCALVALKERLHDGDAASHAEQMGIARSIGVLLASMIPAELGADGAISLVEDVVAPARNAAALEEARMAPPEEARVDQGTGWTSRCARCGAKANSTLCPACTLLQRRRQRVATASVEAERRRRGK